MDAFAVAVSDGLCMRRLRARWVLAIGVCFGVYQGVMPTIGYFLGKTFTDYIRAVDHVLALILLGAIGGKMLVDAVKSRKEECPVAEELTLGLLLIQGLATSIDALAVGISFAALNVNIITAALFICAVTCVLSCIGVVLGKKSGGFLGEKARFVGGIILIGIGVKIFIEHTFFGG